MGTSTVICGGSFTGSGRTFYNVVMTPATAGRVVLTGNNTFNNLTITGNTFTAINVATSYGVTLSASQSINVNGTFTVTSGTDITYRTFVGTSASTVAANANINCAAVSLINTDFFGVTLTGAAAPASGTNLGNIGYNSGITFPASKTVYWNLGGTQNWNATAWAASSGGTPALSNYPLAQDVAVFNDAGAASTVNIAGTVYVGGLDFSNRTSAMTLSLASGFTLPYLYVGGNVSFGTAVIISSRVFIVIVNATAKTISGNNPNLTALSIVNNSPATLSNDLTLAIYGQNGTSQALAGSLNLNGKTLTASFNNMWGGVTFNGGTLLSKGVTFTTNDVNFVAGTGGGVIKITGSSSVDFFSTYSPTVLDCTLEYALTGGQSLVLNGDATFANITNSTFPASIGFSSGGTFTFNRFSLQGSPGNLVTLGSTNSGLQYILSKPNGIVSSNYLSIKDSIATGGAVWYAGSNSVDAGNNTGWIFRNASNGGMAIFLP